MQNRRKLPIGLDNFEKLRNNDFYYVDKTKLIQLLMESGEKVNLFTRPRRFGKTLNMSMLRAFFEIGTDKSLFDDLYISQNRELCDAYCGKYPVVSVSLKNVDGLTYESAKYRLAESIGREAERFTFLLDSSQLTENDKSRYRAMIDLCNGQYTMSEEVLVYSLQTLCRLLMAHYRQKVILLIDEYDVPLNKAFQHGYYKEMVALIRGLFGQALKTNDSLQFAVLTGCLRVSKESIFTENEVRNLLKAYGLEEHLSETKHWYDGYRFGDADIYCPWDVINHADRLCGEPDADPQSYLINTSGNELVKRFVDKADKTTRDEIEQLVAGRAIEKAVRLELTYDEIDNSINNLWSVLFTTGYLT